jgi:hypothetical protein
MTGVYTGCFITPLARLAGDPIADGYAAVLRFRGVSYPNPGRKYISRRALSTVEETVL